MIARIVSMLVVSAGLALANTGWTEKYEDAKAQAKKENKAILLDFTGSDWCPWCIKLTKEVFDKPEFKTWAKDNLVLVELDFPHEKRQSHLIKTQNEKLQKEFSITGFPTVLIVDADGKLIGKTGYQAGGPAPYIEHLKGILAKKKA